MASKRAFSVSLACIARLASPAPSQAAAATTRGILRQNLLQPRRQQQQHQQPLIRLAHSIPRPRNPSPFKADLQQKQKEREQQSPSSETSQPKPPLPNVRQQPHYELTFTCRPCGHRSRHAVSKQGYHHGTVLIACPSCKGRHVISDHLRIFGDAATTVEELLRARGEAVKRGALAPGAGIDGGDLEFWEDGTVTAREVLAEEEGSSPRDAQAGAGAAVEDDAPPGSTFKSVRPGGAREKEE